MNANQLLSEIRKLTTREPDAIPAGYKSANEWAKTWKIHKTSARIALRRAVKAGLVEQKTFKSRTTHGRVLEVRYFAPTGKRACC